MTHEAGIEAGTDALAVYINGNGFFLEVGFEKALQAYLSASGMVLVPREATEEMVDAGSDVEGSWDVARKTWEIMLAAAPDPFKSKP